MSEKNQLPVPAYTTYTSFSNLISNLRDSVLPSHISRGVVPGSNSAKATMISSLKSLGLIDGEGSPTSDLKELVDADPENQYPQVLNKILHKQYPFLTDGSIDISNTTTEKVAELFKERGATGSTVAKGMSFFLAAAKEAGIEVSGYVKAPKPQSRPKKTRPKPAPRHERLDSGDATPGGDAGAFAGHEHLKDKDRIVVSAYGMEDWEIFVPKGLSDRQWQHGLKIAIFMLENYREETTLKDNSEKEN